MLSSTRRTCLNSPILELSPIRPHSLVLLKAFKYSPLRILLVYSTAPQHTPGLVSTVQPPGEQSHVDVPSCIRLLEDILLSDCFL